MHELMETKIKIIGLTGGIASGKSTVSQKLAELGAIIVDGDKIAHEVMQPDLPAYAEIVEHFGNEILNPDRTIDRNRLGAIVFSDPVQMRALNRIVRPWIYKAIDKEIETRRLAHPNAVLVLDIPLLFEAGLDKICDQIWVVWVDRETQISRLMARNSITQEEAIQRIESQMPLDEKARRADIVIDNNGSMEDTLSLATGYYLDVMYGHLI